MNMIRDYRDKFGTGYGIEQAPEGFRWVWYEPGEPDEIGGWRATLSAALRNAAEDWDDCGTGGNRASVLRGAATKAERREQG